ncbi:MAG: hypothetical protein WCH98_06845 [Verrucomicrobiota bacterium]
MIPVTLPGTVGPQADLVNQNTLDAGDGNCQNYGPMNASRLVGICVFLSISILQAQQQDIAPPNLDTILKEITALEQKQKQGKLTERNSLIGQIQSAAANGSAAASFYTQAVEEVQFKGKKDKVEAFIAWKKAHADLLHSKEMQTALLLHLKYLLMSLQRRDLEKPETQLPALMTYVNELVSCDDLFAKQNPPSDETRSLLTKPISGSIFAQWLPLGEWLPDAKNWEQKPGDIPGILEKNIRSVMRDKKDPQLIQTWDTEMKIEAARITTGRSEHQADQFNTVTRPRLQFKQAQDMAVIGQPNRALTETIALVRANPLHPDFGIWVAKIRESIKPPAQAPEPAAAQTSPEPTPGSAP